MNNICRYHQEGNCHYGDRCWRIHLPRYRNTIESQQKRNNTKKHTVKKGKKRVTFWDAPEANKAPYNTENQSNQAPYNSNKATNNTYEIEQINHTQQKKKTRRGKRSGPSKVIHKLKVMTINTRGIKSKTTSITAALHMNGTHIAAITETLLTGNEDVQISGYQWLGQNRPQKGGGVGFLIRNDIKSLIEEMNTPPSTTLESKWITLKSASKIAIGVVYGSKKPQVKK